MQEELEKITAELITTGEPLTNVIVLAPRGSDADNTVLELVIEGRKVCVAFTNVYHAVIFCVALVKQGIDMSGFQPFNMETLPVEDGIWLDPSSEALRGTNFLNMIHRDN